MRCIQISVQLLLTYIDVPWRWHWNSHTVIGVRLQHNKKTTSLHANKQLTLYMKYYKAQNVKECYSIMSRFSNISQKHCILYISTEPVKSVDYK